MKKYDSYKDSGIEWIGDIPNHWHVKRLKNIGSLYSGLSGKSGSDFEKVPTENFKPFINFTNIANNKYIVGDNFGFVKIDENENQNQVKKNDLFFLMSSENQEDVGKSALLLNDYDELYLNSFCKGFRLTINSDARFINYLLTSSALSQLISLEGRGFTRINLRMEGVENLPIILPQSIEEQTTIANYLDHKTTQIEHLIAKKEQFIQLLEEERVAVINQAVTKGLESNVPMKDSGIEWLGEIPEHWEIVRLKYLSRIRYGLGQPPKQKVDGLPIIRATNIFRGIISSNNMLFVDPDDLPMNREPILKENDIIIVRSGAYTADSAIITKEWEGSVTGYDIVLTPLKVNPNLLAFSLLSTYLLDNQLFLERLRAAQPHLNSEEIGNSFFLLPPDEEQISIVQHIEKQMEKILILKERMLLEIELLKEYKTALISEVVTGKVDVRNEKLK
jgi:type I restriction enzyme S subunit